MSDRRPAAVRPATAQDAVGITQVHVRSWQAAYRGLMPQEYLDGLDPADRLPRWRQVLSEPGGRHGVLVAVGPDDGICGFSSVGPTRDDDQDPGCVAEVRAIYLAPEAMGSGIGRELMAASLDLLARAGYEQVTLWVLAGNTRARRFYEKVGFRPDGAVSVDDRDGLQLEEVRYRRPVPGRAANSTAVPGHGSSADRAGVPAGPGGAPRAQGRR